MITVISPKNRGILTINFNLIDYRTRRWYGKAIIPIDYFPPNVDRFNAYSIHDQHVKPIYKSLYPSSGPKPDFHDLESFAELKVLHSLTKIKEQSSIWREAIKNPWKPDN